MQYATCRLGPAIAVFRGPRCWGRPTTSRFQCGLRQPSANCWPTLCKAICLLAECQHSFREAPLPQVTDLLRENFRLPAVWPGQLLDDVLDFHDVLALPQSGHNEVQALLHQPEIGRGSCRS